MQVERISLSDQNDLSPLTDWFAAHPAAIIVSINIDGGAFYIFYKTLD